MSDLARIDRMTDSDIDYSDIPEFDLSFLNKPSIPWPPVKEQACNDSEQVVHLENVPRAAA